MGKTGKKGGKRLKKKELAKMLMELFQNNPAEVYDIKRIFRDLKLDIPPSCFVWTCWKIWRWMII